MSRLGRDGMGWGKASDNPGLPHLSGSCFWVTLSFKPQFPSLDNGQMQPASHGRRKRSSESPRPSSTTPISQMGKLRLREGLWLAEGHKVGKELKSAPTPAWDRREELAPWLSEPSHPTQKAPPRSEGCGGHLCKVLGVSRPQQGSPPPIPLLTLPLGLWGFRPPSS